MSITSIRFGRRPLAADFLFGIDELSPVGGALYHSPCPRVVPPSQSLNLRARRLIIGDMMCCRGVLFSLFAPAVVLTLAAQGVRAGDETSKVTGSVHIAAGQTATEATTVNGSVEVGPSANVAKRAESVNGNVTVGQHATVGAVETVNGSVHIGEAARITKGVELVNGEIELARGADIGGRVSTVNGSINLTAAHVGGGIETTNANIRVGADSRIEGGILVNRNSEGWFSWLGFGSSDRSSNIPRIVIGPRATVQGPLRFKREVKLYVSDSATIGPVEGATALRFSGERAPE